MNREIVGSWAWDMFCPLCSATLVNGMGDENRGEFSEDDQAQYYGKIIYCSWCRARIRFDDNEVIEKDVDIQSGDILGG